MTWWLWVDSNHQPRAYETFALPLELHSHFTVESSSFSLLFSVQDNLKIELSTASILILEARGGVEPRAVPPDSCRFGLEDRCRERGPDCGGDGEIRTHTLLFTGQPLCQLELHRLSILWP